MFWKFATSFSSSEDLDRSIDEALKDFNADSNGRNSSSENSPCMNDKTGLEIKYHVQNLLSHDNVVQECKNQNKKLLRILCEPAVLSILIENILNEPVEVSKEDGEMRNFKYAYFASEVLSSDILQINEALVSNEELLEKLYSFLLKDPPLNALLASFFAKTFSSLISRKTEQNWYNYQCNCFQVLDFLKKKSFTIHISKHLETSAIVDLILTMLSCVEEEETKMSFYKWLDENFLLEKIIGKLSPSFSQAVHDNACQLLIGILKLYRETEEQRVSIPLLEKFFSPQTISFLLDTTLNENNVFSRSSVINGVIVLTEIMENMNDACKLGSFEANEEYSPVCEEFASRFSFMYLLLKYPPEDKPNIAFGLLRLSLTKFINALISSKSTKIIHCLIKNEIIHILIDHFFEYPHNNFMHSEIEQMIAKSFLQSAILVDELVLHILISCNFIEKSILYWTEIKNSKTPCVIGFSGHLFNIIETMSKHSLKIFEILETRNVNISLELKEKWKNLLKETTTLNKRSLFQQYSLACQNSYSLEDDDIKEAFNVTENFKQVMTDFQMQPIFCHMDESFGFELDSAAWINICQYCVFAEEFQLDGNGIPTPVCYIRNVFPLEEK